MMKRSVDPVADYLQMILTPAYHDDGTNVAAGSTYSYGLEDDLCSTGMMAQSQLRRRMETSGAMHL